jgi:hypothetical protein
MRTEASLSGVCLQCHRAFTRRYRISKKSPARNVKFCSFTCYLASRKWPPEKFWAKVAKGKRNACWLWTGLQTHHGYGVIHFGKSAKPRRKLAHRVAWEFTHGPIPDGLLVCHHCDTPLCCNPQHLFLGSDLDNMRDFLAKHVHHNRKKTCCPHGHSYAVPENVRWYRGWRHCAACERERVKRISEERRRIREAKAHHFAK